MMRYFIIFFLVTFLPFTRVSALTRGEVRTQIRYLINDTGVATATGTYRWSDNVLNARINIVQNEIVEVTRCLYSRHLTTAVAGVQEYDLPSDLMVIDRVAFLSIPGSTIAYRKLDWTSTTGLDRDIANWQSMGYGQPRYYYERGAKVGLYPIPSVSFSTYSALMIDYYKIPNQLTTDSDVPFDNQSNLSIYHSLIAKGVAAMCKLDDGKVAEYQILREEYRALMKEMRDAILTKPDKQEKIITR